MSANPLPLVTLAAEINARLGLTGRTQQKAQDHRIAAGLLLTEAHRRVGEGEAGNITWGHWLAANIHRSPGDVRKLISKAERNGLEDAEAPRGSLKKVAGPVGFYLPRSDVIKRKGGDAFAAHQIILRECSLRALARQVKAAADMVATTNRATLGRGPWICGEIEHLDAAITTANVATDLARKAICGFIKNSRLLAGLEEDICRVGLDKPARQALSQTERHGVLGPSLPAEPQARVEVRVKLGADDVANRHRIGDE